jgi:hypothetical protein
MTANTTPGERVVAPQVAQGGDPGERPWLGVLPGAVHELEMPAGRDTRDDAGE